jgi:chromosomal replication initiator protein
MDRRGALLAMISVAGLPLLPATETRSDVPGSPGSVASREGFLRQTARIDERPLIERFTFDTFIPGAPNDLARKLAIQIADRSPSPDLFWISGELGMGKTHLMHAITNRMRAQERRLRVSYFHMHEYLDMCRGGTWTDFHALERTQMVPDVVLVDSLSQPQASPALQDELLEWLRLVMRAGAHAVVSDIPEPDRSGRLGRAVAASAGSFVTAKLDKPDLELFEEIARATARAHGVDLAEEVMVVIAQEAVLESVREIESAVIKLAAYARFSGFEITPATARKVLADSIKVR